VYEFTESIEKAKWVTDLKVDPRLSKESDTCSH
jgi:hypothetical protein